MSGVEIAGLALGVLPILIAAADYINSRRLDPKRAEFMQNLAFEITFLHMNLTKLANSLSDLPEDLRERLASPQDGIKFEASWQSEEVALALKSRLGTGKETFFVTLRSILESLEKLIERKSLDLPKDETISAHLTYAKLRLIREKSTATPINDLKLRVQYAVHDARKCVRILGKIAEDNERLEKIVCWFSDTSFATPESQKDVHVVGNPQIQLRPLMHTLYDALGGLWPCDCQRKHEARLCLLQHRDSRRDSVTSSLEGGEKIYFDMLMSLSEGNKPYCRWLESQLCIALQQNMTSQDMRGVRFDLDMISTASPTCSSHSNDITPPSDGSSQATFPRRRRASTGTRKKIEKLCHTLLQADRNLCSPQILFDGGCLWHVSSVRTSRRSSRTLSMQKNEVDTSLASLLRGEKKFRLKEKRILSVILANSLLHFCESPWLSEDWSKEHISFFPDPGTGGLDIRKPYLSTNFQQTAQEDPPDALSRIHPNPSVLALGILLLEIELDLPIEQEQGKDDLGADGKPGVNTDYFVAVRLFEGISDDFYRNHRQAVRACLDCDFFDEETMEPSLDNSEFRQAVYNNIVRPLEEELYNAYELTPDDLGLDRV